MKYTTNNSDIKKRKIADDQYYEEDVDGCKKLIDFYNFSSLKNTPNISNASNVKSYGKYDSESQGKYGKKFTRHTRGNSIFDSEGIPVKEVCIYDYNEMEEERIKNLKSFYEPENKDEVQVELEYEHLEDENFETSPMELQSSPDLENNEKTLEINYDEMSNRVKDSSMIELFSDDNEPIIEEPVLPVSTIEIKYQKNHHPSMIELTKFKTFSEVPPHKRTIIEPSIHNRNPNKNKKYNDGLHSKFASHTIQCRKQIPNRL